MHQSSLLTGFHVLLRTMSYSCNRFRLFGFNCIRHSRSMPMGAFIVNLHVRTEDREGLARAARAVAKDGCWVTAPKGGWATVYEERASAQDDSWIRRLG